MKSQKPSIAYYVTAHGYGHGGRSCDIIRAINRIYPQVTVHIVSRLPVPFLCDQIGSSRNPVHARAFDVGMIQLDSIRVDVDATLDKIEDVYSGRELLIAEEAAFLRSNGIGAVVVDIPAMPLEAAALLGIPRLAVGNFSWDWIYADFVSRNTRWERIVNMFHEAYSKADLLLRLPFHGEMPAFSRMEDIPLVAKRGISRRDEIARITGCNPAAKWILLSFTTLEWNEEALARVEATTDYAFFTVRPLEWNRRNIHVLDREQVTFSDVIASMDAVISKPGFGIVSDCIVNGKPLVYAERKDFLEYPILESAIWKYLRHVHIPAADLYSGDLQRSLDTVWSRPEPEHTLAHGGDCIAARQIVQFID